MQGSEKFPDVTLSIRPLRPAAGGELNRFSTCSDLTAKEDIPASPTSTNEQQTKDPQTNESEGGSSPTANQVPPKPGVSFAKQATDKLKWKFLGWWRVIIQEKKIFKLLKAIHSAAQVKNTNPK